MRQSGNKKRMNRARSRETAAEKEARRLTDKKRKRQVIDEESSSERAARMQQMREQYIFRTANETPEERKQRQQEAQEKMKNIREDRLRKKRTYRRFCKSAPEKGSELWQADKFIEMGPMKAECEYCGALMFLGERKQGSGKKNPKFMLCCRSGKVKLPPITVPGPYREQTRGRELLHNTFKRI